MRLIHRLKLLDLNGTLSVGIRPCDGDTVIVASRGGQTELLEIKAGLAAHTPEQRYALLVEIGRHMNVDAVFEVDVDLKLSKLCAGSSAPVPTVVTNLRQLGFATRVSNGFRRLGITTLDQLLATSATQLMNCANLGESSVREVTDRLALVGLRLKDDVGPT